MRHENSENETNFTLPSGKGVYVYDEGLFPPGRPLDLDEAKREYSGDPIGFAEWEVRRAKTWANLIVRDYPKVCRISPPSDGQTQDSRHEGAVHYVIACQHRLEAAERQANIRAGKKHKAKVKSAEPPRQTTREDQER